MQATARGLLPENVRWSFDAAPKAKPGAKAKAGAKAGACKRPAASSMGANVGADARVDVDAAPAGPMETFHVDLSSCEDIEGAAYSLGGHAAAVFSLLRPHWIAGDGNCLYRSVAIQTDEGEAAHLDLRRRSVELAERTWFNYAPFFAEQTPESVSLWARRMERAGYWGDEISCRCLADVLRRPLVVWRSENPEQPPSCFVPVDHEGLCVVTPVYVSLDERVRGAEHYTALLPPGRQVQQPADERPKRARRGASLPSDVGVEAGDEGGEQSFAEARGLEGWEAIGIWGKVGLSRAEYSLLLDLVAEQEPVQARDSLQVQVPNMGLSGVTLKLLTNLRMEDRRKETKDTFEKQQRILRLIEGGTRKEGDLQAACPGVGSRFIAAALGHEHQQPELDWHEEFGRRFSVMDNVATNRDWSEPKVPGDDVASRAHDWARTPSWRFCSECGHRELQGHVAWVWRRNPATSVHKRCVHGCDLDPLLLAEQREEPEHSGRLKAYVTPEEFHWRDWILHIEPSAPPNARLCDVVSQEDILALALMQFRVDYVTKSGGASIRSKQKRSVIRAQWSSQLPSTAISSDAGRRAYEWLMQNNTTYAFLAGKHREVLENWDEEHSHLWIATAKLLLQSPGIEVAAFPWLYPVEGYGDTDLSDRLKPLKQIAASSTPSLKTSWLRKVCSRSVDYEANYLLGCFLYDVSLARTLSTVVNLAEQKKVAPEALAMDMPAFEMYWHKQNRQLEDICRQMGGRLPELFFTHLGGCFFWRFFSPRWVPFFFWLGLLSGNPKKADVGCL